MAREGENTTCQKMYMEGNQTRETDSSPLGAGGEHMWNYNKREELEYSMIDKTARSQSIVYDKKSRDEIVAETDESICERDRV